jgi:hypothetical protein
MIARRARPRFRVLIEVPRVGGWREWGAAAAGFEHRLAAQESASVIAPRVESEARRGRDYVRIRVSATVDAADVGQAAVAVWGAFLEAAAEDATAWDMADASAEIRPQEKALTCLAFCRRVALGTSWFPAYPGGSSARPRPGGASGGAPRRGRLDAGGTPGHGLTLSGNLPGRLSEGSGGRRRRPGSGTTLVVSLSRVGPASGVRSPTSARHTGSTRAPRAATARSPGAGPERADPRRGASPGPGGTSNGRAPGPPPSRPGSSSPTRGPPRRSSPLWASGTRTYRPCSGAG